MRARKQMHQLQTHASLMGRLFIEQYRWELSAQLEAELKKPWYSKLWKKLGYRWFNFKLRMRRIIHR